MRYAVYVALGLGVLPGGLGLRALIVRDQERLLAQVKPSEANVVKAPSPPERAPNPPNGIAGPSQDSSLFAPMTKEELA